MFRGGSASIAVSHGRSLSDPADSKKEREKCLVVMLLGRHIKRNYDKSIYLFRQTSIGSFPSTAIVRPTQLSTNPRSDARHLIQTDTSVHAETMNGVN